MKNEDGISETQKWETTLLLSRERLTARVLFGAILTLDTIEDFDFGCKQHMAYRQEKKITTRFPTAFLSNDQ